MTRTANLAYGSNHVWRRIIGPDWRGTIQTGARHSYRVCDSTGQRQDCVVAVNTHGLHKDIALMVRIREMVQAWGAESLSAVRIGLQGMKRVATIDATGRSFPVFHRFFPPLAKSDSLLTGGCIQ